METIIISDLHLGSEVCQAEKISLFLEENENKENRIILNGDVFDSHDFRRLKKYHWKVLSILRRMSDHKHIIWITGNHDGPHDILSHLLGIDVEEEVILHCGNKNILVLHGDIFDDFIAAYPLLTYFGDWIYRGFQRLDKSFKFCRWLKNRSKTYLRCADKVKNKAIEYAQSRKCDFVICGHTHKAELTEKYANSGCWTENPTYVRIDSEGKVFVENYL